MIARGLEVVPGRLLASAYAVCARSGWPCSAARRPRRLYAIDFWILSAPRGETTDLVVRRAPSADHPAGPRYRPARVRSRAGARPPSGPRRRTSARRPDRPVEARPGRDLRTPRPGGRLIAPSRVPGGLRKTSAFEVFVRRVDLRLAPAAGQHEVEAGSDERHRPPRRPARRSSRLRSSTRPGPPGWLWARDGVT